MSGTITQTAIGGDLFTLALDIYSDPTQWWRLAQANGIDDPMLQGQVRIVAPPADPTLAGLGLPPQG